MSVRFSEGGTQGGNFSPLRGDLAVRGEPLRGEPLRGDPLSSLPVDKNDPSLEETYVMNTLFKEQKTKLDIILENSKDLIALSAIFIFISIPQVDETIKKFFPSAQSYPMLVGIKALLLSISYFIIKNLYLVRK